MVLSTSKSTVLNAHTKHFILFFFAELFSKMKLTVVSAIVGCVMVMMSSALTGESQFGYWFLVRDVYVCRRFISLVCREIVGYST